MRLEELARGRAAVVQRGEVTVALRVVVDRIDHELAIECVGRHLAIAAKRDRDDDDVAEPRGVLDRHRPCTVNGVPQRRRAARVTDRDLVTRGDEARGERAADVPGADDPDLYRAAV